MKLHISYRFMIVISVLIKQLFIFSLQPTRKERTNWVVNPMYCLPAAIALALLGTILIFMDQQITLVIVEKKLKVWTYHLIIMSVWWLVKEADSL